MKVSVLSGKGGVGKSSITASLALTLSNSNDLVCVDCDVETPDLGLFFGLKEKDYKKREVSTGLKAELIEDKCIKCRKCVESCAFSAISWEDKPVFNKFLCEGCGVCDLVCPAKAISMNPIQNGWIGHAETERFPLVMGHLGIGESGSGEIVALVKEEAEKIAHNQNRDWILLDSAAGIGCPVIASIAGSDYVIAITEPTPAALHDLGRALALVNHFKMPYGIVINKANLNPKMTKKIHSFSKKKQAKVLAEIPYDKAFVDSLVELKPAVSHKKELEETFVELKENLLSDL